MRLGEGSAVAQILKIIRSEIWNIRKQRRIRNVRFFCLVLRSLFITCKLKICEEFCRSLARWRGTTVVFWHRYLICLILFFLLSFSSLFWFLSSSFFECLYIVDVGTSNLWKKSHQLTISFDSRLFFVSPQKLVVFALLELTHLPSVCWKRKKLGAAC